MLGGRRKIPVSVPQFFAPYRTFIRISTLKGFYVYFNEDENAVSLRTVYLKLDFNAIIRINISNFARHQGRFISCNLTRTTKNAW